MSCYKQSSFVLLVWLQSRFQTSPLQPNFCHGLGLATGKHGHCYFTNRICSRIVEFMIKNCWPMVVWIDQRHSWFAWLLMLAESAAHPSNFDQSQTIARVFCCFGIPDDRCLLVYCCGWLWYLLHLLCSPFTKFSSCGTLSSWSFRSSLMYRLNLRTIKIVCCVNSGTRLIKIY